MALVSFEVSVQCCCKQGLMIFMVCTILYFFLRYLISLSLYMKSKNLLSICVDIHDIVYVCVVYSGCVHRYKMSGFSNTDIIVPTTG